MLIIVSPIYRIFSVIKIITSIYEVSSFVTMNIFTISFVFQRKHRKQFICYKCYNGLDLSCRS